MSQLHSFYPEIEPYNNGYLKVSDVHQIYYEQIGNPNGRPILYVHGGGGTNGCCDKERRFFDPSYYRAILVDRRALGRSKPFGEIKDNDTWKVVEDYEKLRKFLEIEKWLIFGGSWGSTLTMIYSELYPDRVTGLILRGVTLGQGKDLQWIYHAGASNILPEFFETYANAIPEAERDDIVMAYWRRINSDDKETRIKYAKLWTHWGCALSIIHDHEVDLSMGLDDEVIYLSARHDNHFAANRGFFSPDKENYVLKHIHKIRHIPCIIVHGRYDVICPVQRAWDLHKNWPEADLRIIRNAGHTINDIPLASALIAAIKEFQQKGY
ncbi:uncharacterized protein TRIADDRAFT_27689 [Trichoplax adhaerens]|uniref:Proline iminopeptidase n=1 Tax=Trichoplax adhaerens TaxID=10228 RepID=B3S1Y9_TRIAD|nr:hypothetical protein TRIADDRAFT_27689 [Trichoplax adhaerens]EDV23590.1 hypothetical protein TRIADDRAFT_27689 [Trichoplax adhaerens]|eukprot:XP_002114500.1 hypothetical protein TRIADDRAFT_27689 [Trichoplax adhaerens]